MRLLTPPLPVRLEEKGLSFDPHIQVDHIRGFFDGLGEGMECCLVRGEDKRTWVLMRALRLSEPEGAIGISCDLSKPCLGAVESGLAQELRLTPTEARVLDLFAELQSPREIAATLEISLATVRSHLKQIYAKASVESGVQLLQLIRSYCAA
jgi:DNA-binding CsgD family transcriptional regulator